MVGKKLHRRDGVVVGASASQSVDLGFVSSVESYQKNLNIDIHSFSAWRSAFRGCCGKQAGTLVVSLGKALNETPPSLCGTQVAQTPWNRQLPSECGHSVQKTAIDFAFS